jgi:hypothetical protein
MISPNYEFNTEKPVDPCGTIAYEFAPRFQEWVEQSKLEYEILQLPYNPVDNPEMLMWARVRRRTQREIERLNPNLYPAVK